jgi:hypothetical protein
MAFEWDLQSREHAKPPLDLLPRVLQTHVDRPEVYRPRVMR